MLGISNYRESDFEYISNNNYILETELDNSIYMTKINMQMIAIVEAIFAAMISVLTLILIINYSKNTIDESNREMGILLSMGVKRKKLPSIFIPDILFIFILSLMLSIPLGIFGFLMQSHVVNNTSEFKFQYGYVSFLPFVIVIVSLLIVLFSILFIIFKRVFKKNTIDLIYHK
jgi:ABC-type antimicrobial peptide transport system permease subunit